MRIICISDTHELHRNLDVPNGDVLIHAGDFLFQQNKRSKAALLDFNALICSLPHGTKSLYPAITTGF